MLDGLQHWLASRMTRVLVNDIDEALIDGVPFLLKRRRRGAGLVILAGNIFLRLANSGVRMFVRRQQWIDWEMHCVRLLYPQLPGPRPVSGRCVALVKHRVASLRELLLRRETAIRPFVAAGREICRAHQLPCSRFGSSWSHGDLHLANVLYDSMGDRAFLIDFDTRHLPSLPEVHRHADDLLVLLLELIASADQGWKPLAGALLGQYHDAAVLECLAQRLAMPRGFAKIFFHTRTRGIATHDMKTRMAELRAMIVQQQSTKTGMATNTEN